MGACLLACFVLGCSNAPEVESRQDLGTAAPVQPAELTQPPVPADDEPWLPPSWPANGRLSSVGAEQLDQITREVAGRYEMQSSRAVSAGPAGGFVYVVGLIEAKPHCWYDGSLYDRDAFREKYWDTLHSR